MTDEDFIEGIKSIQSDLEGSRQDASRQIIELVKARFSDAMAALDTETIMKVIDRSNIIDRLIRDNVEKCVAVEVGNRLRCGIYNGTAIDKLLESIWTEQLEIALKDRIRSKAYTAIDAVIAERLKALKAS